MIEHVSRMNPKSATADNTRLEYEGHADDSLKGLKRFMVAILR